MSSFKNSIKKNLEALEEMTQATGEYMTSLEELSKIVESIEDNYVQKHCKDFLTMAINEVNELQHITTQKKRLLKNTNHTY